MKTLTCKKRGLLSELTNEKNLNHIQYIFLFWSLFSSQAFFFSPLDPRRQDFKRRAGSRTKCRVDDGCKINKFSDKRSAISIESNGLAELMELNTIPTTHAIIDNRNQKARFGTKEGSFNRVAHPIELRCIALPAELRWQRKAHDWR